jgi:hypothetical protein
MPKFETVDLSNLQIYFNRTGSTPDHPCKGSEVTLIFSTIMPDMVKLRQTGNVEGLKWMVWWWLGSSPFPGFLTGASGYDSMTL